MSEGVHLREGLRWLGSEEEISDAIRKLDTERRKSVHGNFDHSIRLADFLGLVEHNKEKLIHGSKI